MGVRHPITVEAQVQDWSKAVINLEPPTFEGGPFGLYATVPALGKMRVATCASPKALSEWALNKGAAKVRFDFDLGAYEETR